MRIKEVASILEGFAPLLYQESYDNSGLTIGNPDENVSSVLLTVDITEEVIDEAINKKANLIVAHHPIIFNGLKRITGKDYVERIVAKAIKNDIAVYAAHTNMDGVWGGINTRLGENLGLTNIKILSPKKEELKKLVTFVPDEVAYDIFPLDNEFLKAGTGAIGELPESITELDFLSDLKKKLKIKCIRHSPLTGKKMKRIAVCGGAGTFLLKKAISSKADAFLTADIKYHEYFDADKKILLADIGHYESEQIIKDIFYELLTEKNFNFAVHFSEIITNPVNYY